MGEWKANSLKSRFNNEITYQVATITLQEDGTCIYKGESAKWEYVADLNQFIFTLDKNCASGVLEIAEENGKTVLKYNTETYYRPEDFVAKEKEYVDANGVSHTNLTEISITLDNWGEFFEVYEKVEWQRNDFNEAENLRITQYIGLKEQYRKTIDVNDSSVAFEIEATKVNIDIKLDLSKETYSYTDTINETYEFVETATVVGSEASFFSCCDGYFIKNSAEVPNIEILENIVVSRVMGSIYLYD